MSGSSCDSVGPQSAGGDDGSVKSMETAFCPEVTEGVAKVTEGEGDAEEGDMDVTRPCEHNDWDDVRQRKGVKVLRCRVCHVTWRWPRGARRGDKGLERCIEFLNERCPLDGNACPLLHVRRSKMRMKATPPPPPPPQRPTPLTLTISSDPESASGMELDGMPALMSPVECSVTCISAPSTPRGTAACFHMKGPPEPEGCKRPQTPSTLSFKPRWEQTSTLQRVQNPAMFEFAKWAAVAAFGVDEDEVVDAHWEVMPDRNNNVGLSPGPRCGTEGKIVYLGSFTSNEAALAAAEHHGCFSFTWHSSANYRKEWNLQAYGHIVPTFNSCMGHSPGDVFNPMQLMGCTESRLIIETKGLLATHGSLVARPSEVLHSMFSAVEADEC